MKKIYFCFAFLLFTLILSTSVLAETIPKYTPPQTIDLSKVNLKINESDLFGIRMGEPIFEDKVYNQKDIVNVTLPLQNNTDIDYSDISISAYVMTHTIGEAPQNYGYKNNVAQIFLSKKTNKNLNLQFQMPDSVTFDLKDTTRIEFIALTKSGEMLGVTGKNIKLGSFLKSVNVNSAYLKVGDKEYGLQNGPTINATTSPQLIVEFQNNSVADITLTPKLKVYDIVPSKSEVGNKDYDSFTIKKGETKKMTLDLPIFSKGGVYDGQMHFVDSDGNERAPFVSSRWIVEGDMATIPNVNINKDSFRKGEQAIVKVEYTGSPVNFETGLSADIGMATIKMTLFNENKEIIGEGQQEINLNTMSSFANFETNVSKDASSVSVEVVITKGNVELARYSTTLTDPDQKEIKDFGKYLIWAMLFLLIVMIFVFIKTKKIPTVVIVFAMVLGFSGIFGINQANAQQDQTFEPPTCGPTTCWTTFGIFDLTTSLSKTTFAPGEEMGFSIYTNARAEICANNYAETWVNYNIYNTSGGNIGSLVSTNSAYNSTVTGDNHVTTFQSLPSFSPQTATVPTSVKAPLIPGNYILFTDTSIAFKRGVENLTFGIKYSCTLAQDPPTVLNPNPPSCPIRAYSGSFGMRNYFAFTVEPTANTPQGASVCKASTNSSRTTAQVNWVYDDLDNLTNPLVDPQTSYEVQVATDVNFNNVIQTLIAPANTDVSLVRSQGVSSLDPNTKYYYRVKTQNSTNGWNEFSTCTSVPAVDADTRDLTNTNVTIWWNYMDSLPQDNYQVQVSENADFSNLKDDISGKAIAMNMKKDNFLVRIVKKILGIDSVTAETSIAETRDVGISELISGRTYYARVRASNVNGWGEWSNINFTAKSGFSVSCSADPSSLSVGATTTFSATPINASQGAISYVWKYNNVNIPGSGSTREFSKNTAGSYQVTVSSTDSSGKTANNTCSVQFNNSNTSCSLPPPNNCSSCNETTDKWYKDNSLPGCSDFVDPNGPLVTKFKITPNYVDTGNKCGLQLEATNTSGCDLVDIKTLEVVAHRNPDQNNSIDDVNVLNLLEIGTYVLKCTGIGENPAEETIDTKACYSNPEIIHI